MFNLQEVRLTMWNHLFLEFWLLNTLFFADWCHQRAVIASKIYTSNSPRKYTPVKYKARQKAGFQIAT